MAEIPGLAARRAALKLTDAVLRRGETLDRAAPAALKGLANDADRALARALAAEVFRWLTDLDALIDSATKKRLPGDAKARAVLRLMLAGWLRLDTPPHAVVATGLPLLAGGPRRLAHGVFGALTRKGASLPEVPTLPETVAERWGERAGAIATGLAEPPPLDVSVTEPDVDTEIWADELGGKSLMMGHVRLPRGTAIERLPGYADGGWWVQDLAAQLPVHLFGDVAGKTVLDLCAAPGGKSMQLAARYAAVTPLDSSARRLELLRKNFARTCLRYHEIIHADVLEWEPAHPYDAILLDAPCTATGTCRRHPEVLYRTGPRQIAEMSELQSALLERAVRWLKPGGTLVYAVCSLEREEGEEQAARIPFETVPIEDSELPEGLSPTPEGWLRTDPGMLPEAGGLDGFFIARFRATS